MMTDEDLFATCIWSEARGEPYDGKVAVGRVIRNRMARHYQSDGTVQGTILHPLAFSGFWFNFVDGQYERVAHTLTDALALASNMLNLAQKSNTLADCVKSVADSDWSSGYVGGSDFQKLTHDAVLYENPKISSPNWATQSNFVCTIGAHNFYRDL
jgi:spore germination cell wall hydrolase CwlJ-like protein